MGHILSYYVRFENNLLTCSIKTWHKSQFSFGHTKNILSLLYHSIVDISTIKGQLNLYKKNNGPKREQTTVRTGFNSPNLYALNELLWQQ